MYIVITIFELAQLYFIDVLTPLVGSLFLFVKSAKNSCDIANKGVLYIHKEKGGNTNEIFNQGTSRKKQNVW